MMEDDLFELTDSVLKPLGLAIEDGEEFREPALDVLRYYVRRVKLGILPIVGQGLSVVAVTRQPVDVGIAERWLSLAGFQAGPGRERPISARSQGRGTLAGIDGGRRHARADRPRR